MYKKITPFLVFSFILFSSRSQVLINSLGVPYSQDFNSLGNSGTSGILPTGWLLLETGTGANTTYTADNGALNTGNTYSFGAAAATDRAFGGIQSGSVLPTIGVQFLNNSGSTITSISINYTGEQWRLGTTGRVDRMDFQYSTDAASLSTGTWADENNLDFTAPVTSGIIGALDGNNSSNRTLINVITISGLSITNGSGFWLRWNDFNATSSDDGLGIDDFAISYNGAAAPVCTEPLQQASSLILTPSLNAITGSFSAAVPAADGYITIRSLLATLSANPTDGTSYTAGAALGGGTVVSTGSALNFNDNGLVISTVYYYFIFAYNSTSCSGGPNYLGTLPLSGSSTTLALPVCSTPPNPPTNLILTPAGTSINGTFTAATGASNYLVVRSNNPAPGFSPSNGTTYSAGQVIGSDVIVSYSTTNSFTANGLANNTLYYFFVFSANGSCTGEPYYNSSSLAGFASSGASGIPPGYYNAASGLTCGNLKTALRNIVAAGQVTNNYSTIDNAEMPAVDTIRSDDGLTAIIWDIYSNNNSGIEPFTFNSSQTSPGGFCGGSSPGSAGICWNKEHTFPRSWFKLSNGSYEQPTEADLFLVRPTDSKVNSNRANYIYSAVGTPYSYQMPTVGQFAGYPMPPNPVITKMGTSNYPGITAATALEPNDAVKGDLARGYFYILTRYQSNLSNWISVNAATTDIDIVVDGATNGGLYPSLNLPYLQMLYGWHIADPVDAKEINRNNLVYGQQNNRNPYIDHPEYVNLVWSCTGVIPVTIIDFTAQKNNETVLLQWQATRETSFKEYEVQRSMDGINFYKVGSVAGRNFAGYDFTDVSYSTLPLRTGAAVFYRLKMIDIDGKFNLSRIVSVKQNSYFSDAIVFPNPATGKLTVRLHQLLSEKGLLFVTDPAGRNIMQLTLAALQNNIDLNVNHLPAGRYFIKIIAGRQVINQSFMVIR
jgi:endonuclease I